MALQRDYGNANQQHGSNGLAMRIKWFGNTVRMVLQHRLNGFVTQIECFGNADRMNFTGKSLAIHSSSILQCIACSCSPHNVLQSPSFKNTQ